MKHFKDKLELEFTLAWSAFLVVPNNPDIDFQAPAKCSVTDFLGFSLCMFDGKVFGVVVEIELSLFILYNN